MRRPQVLALWRLLGNSPRKSAFERTRASSGTRSAPRNPREQKTKYVHVLCFLAEDGSVQQRRAAGLVARYRSDEPGLARHRTWRWAGPRTAPPKAVTACGVM